MLGSDEMGKDIGNRGTRSWGAAFLPLSLVMLVLFLWLSNWYLLSRFVKEDKRGQFGDQFGSVNALFSGLAFAGLISAILLQKRELALQREQLELQREEMRESRLQLAEQARVQEGSRKAAIASLKVEALKIRMSALEAQMGHYSDKTMLVRQIREEAERVEAIIKELEV